MKTSKKSILRLTLNREPFGEIVAGTKKFEYREVKKYWKSRLEGREFDVIVFRNGYLKNAPEMEVEFKGCEIRKLSAGRRYAIRLGKILKLKRWKS